MNTFRAVVIIPMVQVELTVNLLESIASNSIRPVQIVVINNAATDLPGRWDLPLTVYKPPEPLGVNASWKYGCGLLNRSHELISFLNDDLLVSKHFFSGLSEAFHFDSSMGVACPVTVKYVEDLGRADVSKLSLARMRKREGWAFTIRRDVFSAIPPFPENMVQTFCGDDWYWYWSHRAGFYWCYMLQNFCFHYGSVTVKQRGLRKTLKHEKRAFNAMLSELA